MNNGTELSPGIYPPLPTFFAANEDLDLLTLQRHIFRLKITGIAGYVVMGTNGEAVHLSRNERVQVIEMARSAAGEDAYILAGCGEQSTRATLENCHLAAQSGANAALVLPPSYFKGRMDRAALLAHYRRIADSSPLPVVIYNMPASAAGLDLDAETICALAEHPNIIGVKDSAGNMAKLATVCAQTPTRFRVFAGSAGYLLPALVVGAIGAVAALANIFPHEVCRLQELFQAGQLEEARLLQARLAPANTAVTTAYSVPGLKAALDLTCGYGGIPRSPLLPLNEQERSKLADILSSV
ncbi:MAG TPA: dihydrodipicolinate synthase family protein [Ktedonobacteraceae bacterium]|nr:dihydrodipicolinate synthase family protein [Ktedonobacteraceae bacterium]